MRHIDDAMTKFVDAFRAHQKRVENDQQHNRLLKCRFIGNSHGLIPS
jgi:hypothetical protein